MSLLYIYANCSITNILLSSITVRKLLFDHVHLPFPAKLCFS